MPLILYFLSQLVRKEIETIITGVYLILLEDTDLQIQTGKFLFGGLILVENHIQE